MEILKKAPDPVRQLCARLALFISDVTKLNYGQSGWELKIMVPKSVELDTNLVALVFKAAPFKFDEVMIFRGWITLKWSCRSMANLKLPEITSAA